MLRPERGKKEGGFCLVYVFPAQKAFFLFFLPDFLTLARKVLPVKALKNSFSGFHKVSCVLGSKNTCFEAQSE